MLVPLHYGTHDTKRWLYRLTNRPVRILNLAYEQMHLLCARNYVIPSGPFALEELHHLAWEERFKTLLLEAGINEENIHMTGHPRFDLLSAIAAFAVCMWVVVLANTIFYMHARCLRASVTWLTRLQIKELVKFSVPLSGTYFIGWLLSSSDIYLLKQLSTGSETGDYVFAIGIASFVALITQSALTDWPRGMGRIVIYSVFATAAALIPIPGIG